MNNEIQEAVAAMNALPDISGQDSGVLKFFTEQTAKEIKTLGGVSASKSLQMIGHMRSLEMQLRGQSQGLPDEATCPECGEVAAWQPCKHCRGTGVADCECEGLGGRWFCSYGCQSYR